MLLLDACPPPDACTPAISIGLGSGNRALLIVAAIIVLICAVPFMGGGGKRG